MITPLHAYHIAAGARMVDFAGWDMPLQYKGIVAEHLHTRTRCSIFDTCHMGEFELYGPTAETDLERLLTMDVAGIPEGRCRYGYLLNAAGGVLDDLMCYRLASDRFMLVVNAGTCERDAEWIRTQGAPTTTFVDQSDDWAKLDVQGPTAQEDLQEALGETVPALPYFGWADWSYEGHACRISRTGYTGEWGYELYVPISLAARLWERITASGVIQPAGLGARDTLRLEAGYPLYGHELSEQRTPVAASGAAFLCVSKDFIGKAAVQKELETPPSEKLVGLRFETRRAAREGSEIWADDQCVGTVSSGAPSPALGVAIALAYVQAEYAAPGARLAARLRGTDLPATVVPLPFYAQGTARKRCSLHHSNTL